MKPWRSGLFCGEALRYWRQQARLRQKDVAAALNMSKTTILHYESGEGMPRGEDILTMSKVIGCRFDALFEPPPAPIPRQRINSLQPQPQNEPRRYLTGLRAIREERGLTQMQIALAVGVHVDSVWSWENCKNKPSLQIVEHIAALLAVDPLQIAPK